VKTLLTSLDRDSYADAFNFVSTSLGGATKERRNWNYGQIWGFSPVKGNAINRSSWNMA